jgi:Protein of unknown function DUF115
VTRASEKYRRLWPVFRESGWRGGLVRLAGSVLPPLRARFIASPWFYRFASRRTAALIAGNERFRDRHRGQTAYVAATGPSLSEQDLSALRGGLIVAVNENFSYLRSRGINVHYNVLYHVGYFTDPETYAPLWRDFPKAVMEQNIVPVIPSYAASMVAKDKRWEAIDPAYFFDVGDFLAVADVRHAGALDFTRPIPGLYTVTHVAIAWAIFLGCREIRVLGVDLDFVDDPTQPMRHCYGSSPYPEHDSLSTNELYVRNSMIPPSEISRHAELQKMAFSRLGEVALAGGQVVIDSGLRGQAGDLPKEPLRRINDPA